MISVMNRGMKQSDHFCFPLHRKSQMKSFVVITSVFEIIFMTHTERERDTRCQSQYGFGAQTWSETCAEATNVLISENCIIYCARTSSFMYGLF